MIYSCAKVRKKSDKKKQFNTFPAFFERFSIFSQYFACVLYTFLKKINKKRLFHAYGWKENYNSKSHIF